MKSTILRRGASDTALRLWANCRVRFSYLCASHRSRLSSCLPRHRETITALESEVVWTRFAETEIATAVLRVASKLGRHHQGRHGTRTEDIRIRGYQESVNQSDSSLPCEFVPLGSNSAIGERDRRERTIADSANPSNFVCPARRY
jgi:hypothetical protein